MLHALGHEARQALGLNACPVPTIMVVSWDCPPRIRVMCSGPWLHQRLRQQTWKWCSRSALGMVPPEKKYLAIQSSSPFTCSNALC